MNKETITVKYVNDGKWGKSVLAGETWYNIDKKSGLTGDEFEKGSTYTILVNESKTGKKYISQIIAGGRVEACPDGSEVIVPVPKVKAGDDKILKDPNINPSNGTPYGPLHPKKEVDWDAVNRGKVACVQFEAALQSPGLAMYATSKEDYLKLVKEAAELGIKFTWDNQRG